MTNKTTHTIKSIAKYDDNSIIISIGDNPEDKFVAYLGDKKNTYDEVNNVFRSVIVLADNKTGAHALNETDFIIVIRCPDCGQIVKLVCVEQIANYVANGPQLESRYINGDEFYHCPDCNKDFVPEFTPDYDVTKLWKSFDFSTLLFRNLSNIKRQKVSFLIGRLLISNMKGNQVKLETCEGSITKRKITFPFLKTSDEVSNDISLQMMLADITKLFPNSEWFASSDLFSNLLKEWTFTLNRVDSIALIIKNAFLILEEFPKKEDYEFLLSEEINRKYIYDTNSKRLLQKARLLLSKPRESIELYNSFIVTESGIYPRKDLFSIIDIISASNEFKQEDFDYLRKKVCHLLPKYENEVLFILNNFNNDFCVLRNAVGKSYISANKLDEIYVFLKAYQRQFGEKCSKETFIKKFRKIKQEARVIIKHEYSEYFKDAPVVEKKLPNGKILKIQGPDLDSKFDASPLMISLIKNIVDKKPASNMSIPCSIMLYNSDGTIFDGKFVSFIRGFWNGLCILYDVESFISKYGIPKIYIEIFNKKMTKFQDDKDLMLLGF